MRKSTRSYKGRTYTNYLLVESFHTPKGPRQKSICSLGDLSPRPREEWLKLACRIEDALVGQGDLLDTDDAEVADIVRRVRARRAKDAGDNDERSRPRADGGGLIKVDPSRVATERHREAGPVHVGHQFWQRLELDRILRDCELSESVRQGVLSVPASGGPGRSLACPVDADRDRPKQLPELASPLQKVWSVSGDFSLRVSQETQC